MRILSFIIWYFLLYWFGGSTSSDPSPHGKDLKISCSECHTTKGWTFDKENATFDHASTKMPLTGQHQTLNCKLCHASLVFSEAKAKTECVNCHNDVHYQTLGNYCDKCHTPDSWLVTNITEIHQQGRFPLLGVHIMTECQQCHKSESLLRYDVLGVECVDCHKQNYDATTSPNHATAGFSTECIECHYIYAYEWSGTGFNHNFFPLTLGHSNIRCEQCHTNNNYTSVSSDCYSCHRQDYETASNPVHTGGCFSTDCQQCHTTNPGWTPVNYLHTATFPLTQGHANVSCSKCHTNPDCANISSDCYACHRPDYEAATNPVHVSGCYPTTCASCHTTNPGWSPVNFQHDNYFPISSGKHSGFNCNECHTNPNNCTYSCIDCHEHNQSDMANKHDEVSGYSWVSSECLRCHPKGIAED